MYTLYIGNKNYSTWSLRAWVLMKTAGIPFREAVVPRDQTLQIFVRDPDGIMLELNFQPHESARP